MDDRFLYEARPPVRAEFVGDLLARLNARRNWKSRLRATVPESREGRLRAGLLLLALGTAGVAVWQGIEYFWERRGEFWVHEGDIQCLQVYWGDWQDSDMNPPSQAAQLPRYVPVADALAMLDYEVKIPAWVPNGLVMRDTIPPPATPDQEVFLYWEDGSHSLSGMVALLASLGEYTPEVIAQRGAVDVIEIAGQPAMLVRGRCAFPDPEQLKGLRPGSTYQTAWDETMASLTWRQEGVTYRLWTNGPVATAADLVRMANSAR